MPTHEWQIVLVQVLEKLQSLKLSGESQNDLVDVREKPHA
jgi:hypothetical protein